ncbi:MAG: flagellar biosynthesis regulator FlaF [Pseudomonadota bacterium]
MSNVQFAQSAYASATAITPSSRDSEYRAFAEVTRRLAVTDISDPTAFPRLAEAVQLNQRLWGILAADVAEPGNGLPDAVRAQIVYLAEFTRQHSSKVLREKASPEVLIGINTAIMKGLRGTTQDVQ